MFTLFRTNVLGAEGSMHNLSLGTHCWIKNQDEYRHLQEQIQTILSEKSNKFAVYDVISTLMGIPGANKFAMTCGIPKRFGAGDKRPREEEDDEESEDEGWDSRPQFFN